MATNVTRNTIFYLNRAFVSVFIEIVYTIEENINKKLICLRTEKYEATTTL